MRIEFMKTSPLLAIVLGASQSWANLASAPVTPPPPVALPSPAPTLRQSIDALSASDLEETLHLLKSNYLAPEAVSGPELERATLEGLLSRLAPGVSLKTAQETAESAPSPFRSEILDQTGYLRIGSLTKANLLEMDKALADFASKNIKAAVIDLRATPESNDFKVAAEFAGRFCPKGKTLFTVLKPAQEQKFLSEKDPLFSGLLVVLVNAETAGAPEVMAAVLRQQTRAMVLGADTKGQGAEMANLPLRNGMILRVAAAKVVLPEQQSVYPKGLKADLTVDVAPETRREILRLETENGVSPYVFETERPRRNEAALVAGTNPEIDPAQIAQRRTVNGKPPVRDVELQRALDLITTISVYESKR